MRISMKDILAVPTVMKMSSELQGRAMLAQLRHQAIREARARDPLALDPIVGEDGSLTWEIVEEVKDGMMVQRRKRITD
jgi:hypothetical protein